MVESASNSEALPEPDLTGRQLGDYLVLRRLGRGGMADVYLAEQQSLRRQIALKVLKPALADDTTYLKRFQNEAQAAANLVHANIVQVHEVGCLDGFHFIAQEYVSGQNLKQIIRRQGTLDARQTMAVVRQVAAALHKAEEQGVIHRDIKPENILITRKGEVKVADFGLARITADGDMAHLTQDGVTMGTPLYMSPEQVEGRPVDRRTDIYSLGVTAYHMLSGHPPFDGETLFSIAAQHLQNEPERLENQRDDLPEGLCRIVHKMLQKTPGDRYQRATELLRELRLIPSREGEDETWAGGEEEWTTPELIALADSQMEATQQLGTVMLEQARLTGAKRRWFITTGATAAVAIVCGGVAALIFRPPSLISGQPELSPQVKRRATARDQYLYATLSAPEELRREALESVERHFPPADSSENEYYSRLAQQRLAELHWNNDEFELALPLYRDLARSEEPQFRAHGLIGQANDAHRRGHVEAAEARLYDLTLLWRELATFLQRSLRAQLHTDLRNKLDRLQLELREGPAESSG